MKGVNGMRSSFKLFGSVVVAASLVLSTLPPCPLQAHAEATDEYVVLLADDACADALHDEFLADAVQSSSSDELANANACALKLTQAEANSLRQRDEVELVEQDIVFEALSCEADFDEGEQQGSQAENVGALWNRSFVHADADEVGGADGSGVKVVILDSGLVYCSEYEHGERVDLIGNKLEDPLGLHCDLTGHGTAVNTVVATLAPEATVDTVRILDENNQASLSRVIAGIQWAIDNHADIINMSFGSMKPSEILHTKLQEAHDAGILLVGAAGNTGTAGPVMYPAAYDEVVSVGAVDAKGDASAFSPSSAELAAPGESVVAEGLFGGTATVEGTSIAAPHVSAAAALLLSGEHSGDAQWVRGLLGASANITRGDPGVVDVGMAWNSAGSYVFESANDDASQDSLVERRDGLEDLGAEIIVSGQWSASNHESQVGGLAQEINGVESKYITLAAKVAYYADSYYPINGSWKRFYPLHAFGFTKNWESDAPYGTDASTKKRTGGMNNNFVADMKYLYRLARYVQTSSAAIDNIDASGGDATIPATSVVKRAGANASILWQIVARKSKIVGSVANSGGIIHSALLNGFSSAEKHQAAAWATLGLALHMMGDVYAHRTRVPKSAAVAGKGKLFDPNNPGVTFLDKTHKSGLTTTAADKALNKYLKEEKEQERDTSFMKGLCRCKDCVIRAVANDHMEFRDIVYATGVADKDDSINVYRDRYHVGSLLATRKLLKQFASGGDFSVLVFLPVNGEKFTYRGADGKSVSKTVVSDVSNSDNNTYKYRLNCLEKYIDDTGTTISDATRAKVKMYSTGAEI